MTIVDVNEFAPEFSAPWTPERPVLSFELREELAPGTVFGRVRATDRDTLVRRYQADEGGLVRLDPATGERCGCIQPHHGWPEMGSGVGSAVNGFEF